MIAKETDDHEPDRTRRRFAVDTTPPRVEIDTPAPGAVYAQGQAVAAGYRCDEPICAGSVADGDPVPTATPGPQSFLVTAADPAGNVVTVRRDYTVTGPAPLPLAPAPLVPTRLRRPTPPSSGRAAMLPSPDNASHMRPRLGAEVRSTEPLLRWRSVGDATLYNVQVFRLTGKRLVKVLSIFPADNRVRVPAGRLTPGAVARVARVAHGARDLHGETARHQQLRGEEVDRPTGEIPLSVQVFTDV